MSQRSNESGFTLIELMFSIAIMAIMIPGLFMFMQMGSVESKKKTAASQIKTVGEALSLYAKDNYLSLKGGGVTNISINDLASNDYLPSSWDNNTENPWGQTYKCYVDNPSGDNLQAYVLTQGGDSLSTKEKNEIFPSIASMIGAQGGYIPAGDLPGQSAGNIQGALGGWEKKLSSIPIPNPGPGHLAWTKHFQEGVFGEDYLYRTKVPGHPELNRMSVDLDMDGNNIDNIETAEFDENDADCSDPDIDNGSLFFVEEEGFYTCRKGKKVKIADERNEGYFQEAKIVSVGSKIKKPNCINSDSKIHVSPSSYSVKGKGNIRGLTAWADTSKNDPYWTVRMQAWTDSGHADFNKDQAKILVVTKCQ